MMRAGISSRSSLSRWTVTCDWYRYGLRAARLLSASHRRLPSILYPRTRR